MTNLSLNPPYEMLIKMKFPPLKSKCDIEGIAPIYHKLKGFLGVYHRGKAPGMYRGEHCLFRNNNNLAWWHEIRWMPKLKNNWRRLKFDEFCAYYQIKL